MFNEEYPEINRFPFFLLTGSGGDYAVQYG